MVVRHERVSRLNKNAVSPARSPRELASQRVLVKRKRLSRHQVGVLARQRYTEIIGLLHGLIRARPKHSGKLPSQTKQGQNVWLKPPEVKKLEDI